VVEKGENYYKKAKPCGKHVAKKDRVRSRKRHIFYGFVIEREETRGKLGAKRDRLRSKKGIFATDLR